MATAAVSSAMADSALPSCISFFLRGRGRGPGWSISLRDQPSSIPALHLFDSGSGAYVMPGSGAFGLSARQVVRAWFLPGTIIQARELPLGQRSRPRRSKRERDSDMAIEIGLRPVPTAAAPRLVRSTPSRGDDMLGQDAPGRVALRSRGSILEGALSYDHQQAQRT